MQGAEISVKAGHRLFGKKLQRLLLLMSVYGGI
jgi:hypothetical protein